MYSGAQGVWGCNGIMVLWGEALGCGSKSSSHLSWVSGVRRESVIYIVDQNQAWSAPSCGSLHKCELPASWRDSRVHYIVGKCERYICSINTRMSWMLYVITDDSLKMCPMKTASILVLRRSCVCARGSRACEEQRRRCHDKRHLKLTQRPLGPGQLSDWT